MANKGVNKHQWATVILQHSSKFLESLTMGKTMQTRYKLIPSEHLNRATRAGVIDMSLGRIRDGHRIGAPIIRFDDPHRGMMVPHINIDPQGHSNASNPHIKVPANLISCAHNIDKCLKTVSKGLLIVALITDGVRIGAAIYEDTTSDEKHVLPNQTIKTIASIIGGWSGAAVGAYGGVIMGAWIGACVGSLFGGVGAVIGAPIGAIIGGFAGATGVSLLGSYLAEQGAQKGIDYYEQKGKQGTGSVGSSSKSAMEERDFSFLQICQETVVEWRDFFLNLINTY